MELFFESGVSGPSHLFIPGRTQPDECREHPALVQGSRAGGMEKPEGVEVIRKVLLQEHRPHPMGLWEPLAMVYLMPVNLQAPKTPWLQGSDV